MAFSLYDLSKDKKLGGTAVSSLTALGIQATVEDLNKCAGITANVQSQLSTITQLITTVNIKTATITTTWIGSAAPYTQEITVLGLTSSSIPTISPVYSEVNATAILQKEAWNMVGRIITGTDKITVICFEEKPTVEIPIQIIGG